MSHLQFLLRRPKNLLTYLKICLETYKKPHHLGKYKINIAIPISRSRTHQTLNSIFCCFICLLPVCPRSRNIINVGPTRLKNPSKKTSYMHRDCKAEIILKIHANVCTCCNESPFTLQNSATQVSYPEIKMTIAVMNIPDPQETFCFYCPYGLRHRYLCHLHGGYI